jgi:hypothetical protein
MLKQNFNLEQIILNLIFFLNLGDRRSCAYLLQQKQTIGRFRTVIICLIKQLFIMIR